MAADGADCTADAFSALAVLLRVGATLLAHSFLRPAQQVLEQAAAIREIVDHRRGSNAAAAAG